MELIVNINLPNYGEHQGQVAYLLGLYNDRFSDAIRKEVKAVLEEISEKSDGEIDKLLQEKIIAPKEDIASVKDLLNFVPVQMEVIPQGKKMTYEKQNQC